MSKINLADIISAAEQKNWKVNSTSYINLKTEMNFTCPEGHEVILPWGKIRDKFSCPICKQNKFHEVKKEVQPKPPGSKRVFALDQATYVTGWSIYTNSELTAYGTFETHLDDEIARDDAVRKWVISMISSWKPDVIGIEDIQLQQLGGKVVYGGDNANGIQTFKILAHLQGILMETAYEAGLPFKIAHTAEWRSHCKVTGKHRTDKKRSAQLKVKSWFDITVSEDEADAICIGKFVSETVVPARKPLSWG